MRKLRINDKVTILTGDSKGHVGKIKKFVKNRQFVIVEGGNLVKKHVQKGIIDQNAPGTIVEIEAPVHVSNVKVICPSCKKPTKIVIDKKDGKSFRKCAKCGELIDGSAKVKKSKSKSKKVKSKDK